MRGWLPRAGRLLALATVLVATAMLPPGAPLRTSAPRPVPVFAEEPVPLFIDQPPSDAIVGGPPQTTVPATPALPSRRMGGTYVPVLLYHYIRYPIPGDRVGFGLSVPPPMFHQQMQYLAANGFHVCLLYTSPSPRD